MLEGPTKHTNRAETKLIVETVFISVADVVVNALMARMICPEDVWTSGEGDLTSALARRDKERAKRGINLENFITTVSDIFFKRKKRYRGGPDK
jgi:hypothetical protein